jgi:predicted nucleic acid binding AN1-type Zn finger protein
MASVAEKAQGLLEVGQHCFICNKLDFLPFKCYDCNKTFCADHKRPEAHDCEPVSRRPASQNSAQRTTGSRLGTGSPSGNRLGGSRSTSVSRTSSPDIPSGHATGSRAIPSTTSTTSSSKLEKLKSFWAAKKSVPKPKRPNQALALAELKKSAKGDDKIPMQDRIYFYIERPESRYIDTVTNQSTVRPAKKLPVYFSKDMVVGRVLDKSSELLSISNRNSNSDKKIGLYSAQLLPYSAKLGDLVKNGDQLVVK